MRMVAGEDETVAVDPAFCCYLETLETLEQMLDNFRPTNLSSRVLTGGPLPETVVDRIRHSRHPAPPPCSPYGFPA